MKRTRKKTTKQETLQQPTVAITMTAEDKAAAEKVAALREAEAAQKAREDAIEATYRKRFDRHFEELRWLYMELYGNSSMFAELCEIPICVHLMRAERNARTGTSRMT